MIRVCPSRPPLLVSYLCLWTGASFRRCETKWQGVYELVPPPFFILITELVLYRTKINLQLIRCSFLSGNKMFSLPEWEPRTYHRLSNHEWKVPYRNTGFLDRWFQTSNRILFGFTNPNFRAKKVKTKLAWGIEQCLEVVFFWVAYFEYRIESFECLE